MAQIKFSHGENQILICIFVSGLIWDVNDRVPDEPF